MIRRASFALLPLVLACGARGGLAEGADAAWSGPGSDADATAGLDAATAPDAGPEPRFVRRQLCTRVRAERDDVLDDPECLSRQDEAARLFHADGETFQSAVVRLDLGSLRVVEVAFATDAYGTFGRRDQAVIDDAERLMPVGTAPEIWYPSTGAHLTAVRRTEDPAGSVVVSPLLAAQTGTTEGAVIMPTEWYDASPLDRSCPSAVTLDACGLDVRTGTELPEELTRPALESVLGTVLLDLIVRSNYVFDTMVVRWAPTTSDATDDRAGELFVVIAAGYLE